MKDHEIAKLINDLRDIAIDFHAHQCLRELIKKRLKPLIDENAITQATAHKG